MVDDARRAQATRARAAHAWAEVHHTRVRLDKQHVLIARGWSLVAEARERHCGIEEIAMHLSSAGPHDDTFVRQ